MDNVMKIEFSALAENEAFARAVAASFVMPLDPTVEELTEIKTAVSEAVSNCIIHGYKDWGNRQNARVFMECSMLKGGKVVIKVRDEGSGIEDIKKAMEPLFTTGSEEERSGMGFTVMESFMDKLVVESEKGKGTTVIMTKYLDIISVE
ncbi:MAG: anti-sigma F factor [Lentihominibacter sp.]|nr:anti-sigma F factor [Clostridiales bacterium]MDY2679460.1 anti-sigma F factor [Lentihominibacter sp.]